jgi:hypothetical protein
MILKSFYIAKSAFYGAPGIALRDPRHQRPKNPDAKLLARLSRRHIERAAPHLQ